MFAEEDERGGGSGSTIPETDMSDLLNKLAIKASITDSLQGTDGIARRGNWKARWTRWKWAEARLDTRPMDWSATAAAFGRVRPQPAEPTI